MKNEKIVALRVHQSVVFDGTQVSNFTPRGSRGKHPADITLMSDIQCVLVESATDRALIPFVNIAYMKLDSVLEQEKESAAKAEVEKKKDKKPQSVKRPR